MELKNVRTPEQMIDYIIADLSTYRHIYTKSSQRYGYITELIGELSLIKEEYLCQTGDDFPNCQISGCEAASIDCHETCPYGRKEKQNDQQTG